MLVTSHFSTIDCEQFLFSFQIIIEIGHNTIPQIRNISRRSNQRSSRPAAALPPPPPPPIDDMPPPPPYDIQKAIKFCSHCGMPKHNRTARFCLSCGRSLDI